MTRKYILKPGRHQFAPGSHAVHENENLSDEEAEWYLKQYPHIAALFETMPNAELETLHPKNPLSFGESRGDAACRVSVMEPVSLNTELSAPADTIGESTDYPSVESLSKISESKKHK